MIYNELPLAFPWYNHRGKQHRWRKNCKGQIFYDLITPQENMLPFQLMIPGTAPLTVVSWDVYDACANNINVPGGSILTEDAENIVTETGDINIILEGSPGGAVSGFPVGNIAQLQVVTSGGNTYVVYDGSPLVDPLDCGWYESRIELSDGSVFWSEVFRVVQPVGNVYPYTMLQWSHPCNLGGIYYGGNFEQKLYLDTFVSHTEPSIVDDVEKDGYGKEILVGSTMFQRWVLAEVIPDYLKTALQSMRQHKNIQLITDDKLQQPAIEGVEIAASVEGSGCYSYAILTLRARDGYLMKLCC